MNCTKELTLTGYQIRYADLREPKPRTIHDEVCVLDRDSLDALGQLRLSVADFIAARYERGGYHVISLERIAPRRVAKLDLHQIWNELGPTDLSLVSAEDSQTQTITEDANHD